LLFLASFIKIGVSLTPMSGKEDNTGVIEKVTSNLDHDQNDDHELETRMMLVFEVISQKFN